MAFIIDIKNVVNEYSDSPQLLTCVLEKMAEFSTSGFRLENGDFKSYTYYAPHLDFSYGSSRTAIGDVLGELWEYCYDYELPYLNFLVLRQDTQLPGRPVIKWYETTFNTLTDFDKYFHRQAELAELMLRNGCVKLL
jgi:hypothetical protein